jgi:hypothetical protein
MNKRFFIFSAAILAFAGMSAQTSGIDAVLQQIEANNKELQANSHLISSQKLENKTNNNVQLGCAMSAALAVLSNISCLSDFTLPIRHVTLILHSEMVLCKLSNCT